MRISLDKDDPGYSFASHMVRSYIKIYLNDKQIFDIVTADDGLSSSGERIHEGYVLQVLKDKNGNIITDNGDTIAQKLTGNVHIEWPLGMATEDPRHLGVVGGPLN